MYPATQIALRAQQWAVADDRVLAAFIHGSVARGVETRLSDVDLVVVAYPGRRHELWTSREDISRLLLGAEVVEAHDVPHQRPFRWQARTADLRMLDLALDETELEMWAGLTGDVRVLVDKGDVETRRRRAAAAHQTPRYDVEGQDDETWAILSWLAGNLLHGRVWNAAWGLTELLGRRILPVAERRTYDLGADPADQDLLGMIETAMPTSLERAEVSRSLRQTAALYERLLDEWAARHDRPRPRSPLAPAVRRVLDDSLASMTDVVEPDEPSERTPRHGPLSAE